MHTDPTPTAVPAQPRTARDRAGLARQLDDFIAWARVRRAQLQSAIRAAGGTPRCETPRDPSRGSPGTV